MGIITKCSLWWQLDNTSLSQGFVRTAWQMSEVQTPPHRDGVPPHLPCIFQRGNLLLIIPKDTSNDSEGRVSLTDWVFCVIIWQRSSWRALSSANPVSCVAADSCSQAIHHWQDLHRLCCAGIVLPFPECLSAEMVCGCWDLWDNFHLCFASQIGLRGLSKCYDSAYSCHSMVHHCQPASQHEQEAHSHYSGPWSL